MGHPFKVESQDINYLSDIQLTQLLLELLHAEANEFGIAGSSVDVGLNIRGGDGGEDGRISWEKGPDKTDFIPNRLTIFQNKATKMPPSDYAKEIMAPVKERFPKTLKQSVEEIFQKQGAYVVFTTQELTKRQKKDRINAIRTKLKSLDKEYADSSQIVIYDASQIASWTNKFIPTIVSVLHWVKRPIERGLKTFNLWQQDEEMNRFPFVAVNSRKDIISNLIENIEKSKSCFRLIGLSGLGKTRTAFQVFKEKPILQNLVVYVDANHAPLIDGLVADWVNSNFRAILIVDNCDYRLHKRLVKEVCRTDSQLSLLTLDYNLETVSSSITSCSKLHPMTDKELLQLLKPIYENSLPDIERVAKFAQGFPQMAVLLAEARLAEAPDIGVLTEDDLANRLLWKRGEQESEEQLKILQACSLFDAFGIDGEVANQLEFIAGLIGEDIDKVYNCIAVYSEREIIDRRGRFGQVGPKPLAIRLAGQWWARTREPKQLELLNNIPETMIQTFCNQIEKMDFHPNVKVLTEKLCGPNRPFGHAEVILSNRGSRLFRSFVIVNPEATCAALYRTLVGKSTPYLQAIGGDTRRNLVWALEKLCFHENLFSDAAWCMLLLASAENERWGNNATEMFAQLFSVYLSGTAAKPEARFDLLKHALRLNQITVDMVVLKALERAINTRGFSRIGDAGYQGMKAPLEEWEPKIWGEVFNYWKEAFNLLLELFERGKSQKEKVISIIGRSILEFVEIGRIEMLDSAIKYIVAKNGQYWPEALDSIKNLYQYDKDKLKPDAFEAIARWEELLSPEKADLPEKIKILVINPPWEYQKAEDGHFIDVASKKAKNFGGEVAKDLDSFLPYLGLLLEGELTQAFSFGYQLALDLADAGQLVKQSLVQYQLTQPANPKFILGLFRGIFEKSPEEWQKNIDLVLSNENLVILFPQLIRTGNIQESHLDQLLELIRTESILPNQAYHLSYGSVTADIEPSVIMKFCLSLAEFGDEATWTAIDIIYMYCFGNNEHLETLRIPIKQLVLKTPIHNGKQNKMHDIHKWYELVKRILEIQDEDFAYLLANNLISECKYGFDYSDIWDYLNKLLLNLLNDYSEKLWVIFSEAITRAKGLEKYWLYRLFTRENSDSLKVPCALSGVPIESIISWCKDNPEQGPEFVAECVDIIETVDKGKHPSELFIALLIHFGNDEGVSRILKMNMATRSWRGSLVPYLKADKAVLSTLLEHKNNNVRNWVKEEIAIIDKEIDAESIRDEERDIGFY